MDQPQQSQPQPHDAKGGNGVPVMIDDLAQEPAENGQPGVQERVGVVGSPSSTREITVDLTESATQQSLVGQLLHLAHPMGDGRYAVALGTMTEIKTQNRWHEDPNMRGVLKVHGSLPHLSGDGDVRTGDVMIQAVYDADNAAPPFASPPVEGGAALGMSPTTGQAVRLVTDDVVQALVASKKDEIVHLGHIYRTDVRLPMFVRHYDPDKPGGSADGAFHTGIFGRSGSGKTSLATYLIACQMRHRGMSILICDPQGQFASQKDLPIDLQDWARRLDRKVEVAHLTTGLRMPAEAPLLVDLLSRTRLFLELVSKNKEARDAATEEFVRVLRSDDLKGWSDSESDEVLRAIFKALVDDDAALSRILSSAAPKKRLKDNLQRALDDTNEFDLYTRHFRPMHSLFGPTGPDGQPRKKLTALLYGTFDKDVDPKPYVILDLSRQSGDDPILDDENVKALLLNRIVSRLEKIAEDSWRSGGFLNCAVYFDEARRYATGRASSEEVQTLANRLVRAASETRKYGLGWTFITQAIGSLHTGIYDQLRFKAYGYGLTSGADLNRLKDEVGTGGPLELYRSFVDPSGTGGQYPFMLTGPVSPLSFTSAPVYLSVYTTPSDFAAGNPAALGATGTPNEPPYAL